MLDAHHIWRPTFQTSEPIRNLSTTGNACNSKAGEVDKGVSLGFAGKPVWYATCSRSNDRPPSITWKVLEKDTQCTPLASTDMSTHAHIHWYTHVHTHIGALNMHKLTQLHTHQISTLNRLLLFYISSQYSNLFYIVYRTLGLTKRPEKTRSKRRLFPQNLHTLL